MGRATGANPSLVLGLWVSRRFYSSWFLSSGPDKDIGSAGLTGAYKVIYRTPRTGSGHSVENTRGP